MKITTGWIEGQPKLLLDAGDGRCLNWTDSVDAPNFTCLDEVLAAGLSLEEIRNLGQNVSHPQYVPWEEVRFSAPIWHPGKIICVGLNYREHVAEGRNERIASDETPTLFVKTNNTLSWPTREIKVPREFDHVDWEGELAVVIGKSCGRLDQDSWPSAVLGYTVANDLSERRLQRATSQWYPGKSVNGFCPLGPWIRLHDGRFDPQNLELTTTVNGAVMQHANTNQMIFPIGSLLTFISSFCDLQPGDVLLTGTPSGVGVHRNPPIFLKSGDAVTVTIEGIGELTNTIAVVE